MVKSSTGLSLCIWGYVYNTDSSVAGCHSGFQTGSGQTSNFKIPADFRVTSLQQQFSIDQHVHQPELAALHSNMVAITEYG